MKLLNTKTLTVTLLLAASVIISIAATKPTAVIITKKPALSDTGFFKNLKILPKDISKEKLDMIMDNFKASLGVRCNFCHAMGDNGHPDFASDAKPEKDIARAMMKMTSDINKNYFNFENSTRPDTIFVVKCVTCHRGNPHPDEVGKDSSMQHHDMPPGMPPSGMPNDSNHKMAPPPPPNK